MNVTKTVTAGAKKLAKAGRNCWETPAMRVRRAISDSISGRPGAGVFKFDELAIKQTSKQSWAFKGVGNRQHMVQGRPLGGERLEISGVFNTLRQEFTKYSEKAIALLREFKR